MANTSNSQKLSNLSIITSLNPGDRILVLHNPNTSPNTVTISTDNFAKTIRLSNTVPANSSANGYAGTVAYSNTHFYVCVATNTWMRAPLQSW